MSDDPRNLRNEPHSGVNAELAELLLALSEHQAPDGLAERIVAAVAATGAPPRQRWWQGLPAPLHTSPWRPALAALVPLVLGITIGATLDVTTLDTTSYASYSAYPDDSLTLALPAFDAQLLEFTAAEGDLPDAP